MKSINKKNVEMTLFGQHNTHMTHQNKKKDHVLISSECLTQHKYLGGGTEKKRKKESVQQA